MTHFAAPRPIWNVTAVLLIMTGVAHAQAAAWPKPAIDDNSFLIEEAFNQDAGVVQHISTFTASRGRPRDYVYGFTQEWPLPNQTHQVSYLLPVASIGGHGSGLGDVMINYRYQVPGLGERLAMAPRVSVVLPTGDSDRDLGGGTVAWQVNLPVSARLTPAVAAHFNAGATLTPHLRGTLATGAGTEHAVTDYTLGASLIAPVTMPINGLLEYLVTFAGSLDAHGRVIRETEQILNPGVRVAINARGAQVVPGFSVMIDAAHPGHTIGVLLYFSIEHAFRHARK